MAHGFGSPSSDGGRGDANLTRQGVPVAACPDCAEMDVTSRKAA